MRSALDTLTQALSAGAALKPHQPEDRDAEAAKIHRLRQLRLAAAPVRKARRRANIKCIAIIVTP